MDPLDQPDPPDSGDCHHRRRRCLLISSKFTDDLDLVSDAFNPSLSQSRHKALGQAGIDLQKEFFSSLGSASAYYVEDSQPGVFGPGFLRLILLNRPSNVDLAATDFAKLWPVNANATGPNFTAKAKDGTLFVGASPQFVDAAMSRAPGDSIPKKPRVYRLPQTPGRAR